MYKRAGVNEAKFENVKVDEMTNLEFLKKHNYITKNLSEDDAKEFIITQSKRDISYKYMIKRARLIKNKK